MHLEGSLKEKNFLKKPKYYHAVSFHTNMDLDNGDFS